MSQSRNIMEYNVFQKESIFNFLIKCYVMSINYTVHLYLVNFYEAGFLGAGPGQSSENWNGWVPSDNMQENST